MIWLPKVFNYRLFYMANFATDATAKLHNVLGFSLISLSPEVQNWTEFSHLFNVVFVTINIFSLELIVIRQAIKLEP